MRSLLVLVLFGAVIAASAFHFPSKVGDRIQADIKELQDGLKKMGEEMKEQWNSHPKDVKGNIKSNIETAKEFGHHVVDQIKEDLKGVKGDIKSGVETTKEYGQKIADQLKQDAKEYADALKKPKPEASY